MLRLFAVFPVASMVLLVAYFNRRGVCWRRAVLSAAVSWGVISTVTTELLSVFQKLNFAWLSASWALTAALLAYLCHKAGNDFAKGTSFRSAIKNNLLPLPIVLIAVTTGVTAVVAPPNNYDSMTYHMSRVVHWMQNQSVEHYPTSILRQIELNPWAEFAITHFQILSGGDYLANLLQWCCMLGCILGAALVAEKLGASPRGQACAALFTATIPMGILQASSTQNDCVVAFWLVCLVYFGILFNEKPSWPGAAAVGASLGLAILTKGTAYLYAFPLSIWLAACSLKDLKLGALKYIVFIALAAISLNLGHYTRNHRTFGNVLSSGQFNYANDRHDASTLLSNLIKNIALQLDSQSIQANQAIESGAKRLHRVLGLDIDAPGSLWQGDKFQVPTSGTMHEDTAGSPLHCLLAIAATAVVICVKKVRTRRGLLAYSSAIVAAFLLFCIYLKWQVTQSRLLLPLIVLSAPVVALVIAESRYALLLKAVIALLVASSLPFLLFNSSRPLITNFGTASIFKKSRMDQYFTNRPELMQPYRDLARRLDETGCSKVGIRLGSDSWEYPLWVLLRSEFNKNLRIEHVDVGNMSGRIPVGSFVPCQTVSIDR